MVVAIPLNSHQANPFAIDHTLPSTAHLGDSALARWVNFIHRQQKHLSTLNVFGDIHQPICEYKRSHAT